MMFAHLRRFAALMSTWVLLFVGFPATSFAQYGSWQTLAPMPTARFGAAGGVIDGVFYVASGCCLSNAPPVPRFSTNEAYQPATNSWSRLASIPLAEYSGASGVIGGDLYVAGGQADQSDGNNIADLQVFDPLSNTWASKAPLPSRTAAAAAGVIAGKLYVAGGKDATNTVFLNLLRVYDPSINSWSSLANMPTASSAFSAAVIDGLLYVMGGQTSGGSIIGTLQVYDPTTNSWATKAPMPTARYWVSSVAADGFLYAIGGIDPNGNILNTVERYDPTANVWSSVPSLPSARYLTNAAVIGNILYVVGGSTSAGASDKVEALSLPFVQIVPEPPAELLLLAGVVFVAWTTRVSRRKTSSTKLSKCP